MFVAFPHHQRYVRLLLYNLTISVKIKIFG